MAITKARASGAGAALTLFTDVRILAPGALGDCGDLAEFCERHGAPPPTLLVPPPPRPIIDADPRTEKDRPAGGHGGHAELRQFRHPKKDLEAGEHPWSSGLSVPQKGALPPRRALEPDTCETCGAATTGPPGNTGRLRCAACAREAARCLGLIVRAAPLEPADPGEFAATDTVPTPLPARPLTCPGAPARELAPAAAAHAVGWADELAALTAEALAAYAARMAGCGPMGQAAILEAKYRGAR